MSPAAQRPCFRRQNHVDASYASPSTCGAQELGWRHVAAAASASTLGSASASTPGTPAGFCIEVAVLNLGMPQETSCSAKPVKVRQASGRRNI